MSGLMLKQKQKQKHDMLVALDIASDSGTNLYMLRDMKVEHEFVAIGNTAGTILDLTSDHMHDSGLADTAELIGGRISLSSVLLPCSAFGNYIPPARDSEWEKKKKR